MATTNSFPRELQIEEEFKGLPNYEPSPSPRRKATKRKQNISTSKPKSKLTLTYKVKRVTEPVSVSKTDISAANKFVEQANRKAILLISAHGCICPQEGECFGKKSKFSFEVPNNTYILSFTTPGGYFCEDRIANILFKQRKELPKLLYIHSTSDIDYGSETVGKTKRSVFGGLRRATGSEDSKDPVLYPNLSLSFNEYDVDASGNKTLKDQRLNDLGVYRLDTLNDPADFHDLKNIRSLIHQSEEGSDWSLEEVIQTTLKRLRLKTAIFVIASCFSRCQHGMQKDMDAAARLMEDAHNRYTNLKPTLTESELEAHGIPAPTNQGVYYRPERMEFNEIKDMHELGVTNANIYLKELRGLLHRNDEKELQEYVNSLKRKATKAKKTRRRTV